MIFPIDKIDFENLKKKINTIINTEEFLKKLNKLVPKQKMLQILLIYSFFANLIMYQLYLILTVENYPKNKNIIDILLWYLIRFTDFIILYIPNTIIFTGIGIGIGASKLLDYKK